MHFLRVFRTCWYFLRKNLKPNWPFGFFNALGEIVLQALKA
jgi:hypothetical protein